MKTLVSPILILTTIRPTKNLGKLNLIEAEEVATAAILTYSSARLGTEDYEASCCRLVDGYLTDTLGFRTSNTTPDSLRQSATLMETGVDMSEIYMRALVNKTYPAARYWGAGTFQPAEQEWYCLGHADLTDRKASGYGGNDDADLINMISAIDG